MSIKRSQPMEAQKPAWDLKEPGIKEALRSFERELEGYKGPHGFDMYCLHKGYIKGEVENVTTPNGTQLQKVKIVRVSNGYSSVLEKLAALKLLQEQTKFAKKQEHLNILGGEPCMGTIESGNRCLMCYPKTSREVVLEIQEKYGYNVIPRNAIIKSMKAPVTPGQMARVEPGEILKIEPEMISKDAGVDSLFDETEKITEADLPF